jgi:hypothetical protein
LQTSNDNKSIDSAPNDGTAPPPLPPPPPPLLPPPQLAEIVLAEEVIDATYSAEYYYINGGSCLKILVAMCYGVCNDNGNSILSLESEPWKSICVTDIKPNKDGYAKEVIRCWYCVKLESDLAKAPHPKQWTLVKIHK